MFSIQNNNNNIKSNRCFGFITFVSFILLVSLSFSGKSSVLAQNSKTDDEMPSSSDQIAHRCTVNDTSSTNFVINATLAASFTSKPMFIYLEEGCETFTLTNVPGIALHSLFVYLDPDWKDKRSSANTEMTVKVTLTEITFPSPFVESNQGNVLLGFSERLRDSHFEFVGLKNVQMLILNRGMYRTALYGSDNTASNIIIRFCTFHFSDSLGNADDLIYFYFNKPRRNMVLGRIIFSNNVVTSSPRPSATNGNGDFPINFRFNRTQSINEIELSNNVISLNDAGVQGLSFFVGSRNSWSTGSVAVQNPINIINNTINVTCVNKCSPTRTATGVNFPIDGWISNVFNFDHNNIYIQTTPQNSAIGTRVYMYVNDDGSNGADGSTADPLSIIPVCGGVAETFFRFNTVRIHGSQASGISYRVAGHVEMSNNDVELDVMGIARKEDMKTELAPTAAYLTTYFCFNYYPFPPGFALTSNDNICPECAISSIPESSQRKWFRHRFATNKGIVRNNHPTSANPYSAAIGVLAAAVEFTAKSGGYFTKYRAVGLRIEVVDNDLLVNSSSLKSEAMNVVSLNTNNIPPMMGLPNGFVTGVPSSTIIHRNVMRLWTNPRGFYDPNSPTGEKVAFPLSYNSIIDHQGGLTGKALETLNQAAQFISFALSGGGGPALEPEMSDGYSYLEVVDNQMFIDCLSGKAGCVALFSKSFRHSQGIKLVWTRTNVTMNDHRPALNDGINSCSESTANEQIGSGFIRNELMPYGDKAPQKIFSTVTNSHFLLKTLPTTCLPFIRKMYATKAFVRASFSSPGFAQQQHVETTDIINGGSTFLFDFGRDWNQVLGPRDRPGLESFIHFINPISHNLPPRIRINVTDGSTVGQKNSCLKAYPDCRFTAASLFSGMWAERFPSKIRSGSYIDTSGFLFTDDLSMSTSDAKKQFRKCPAYFPPNDPSDRGRLNYALRPFAECQTPGSCELRVGCLFQNPGDLYRITTTSCVPGQNGIEVEKVRSLGWHLRYPSKKDEEYETCDVLPPPTPTRELTVSPLPECPPPGEVVMLVDVKPYNGNKYPIAQIVELTLIEASELRKRNQPPAGVPQVFLNKTTNETFISVAPAPPPGGDDPSADPSSSNNGEDNTNTNNGPFYYGFAAGAQDLSNIKIISKNAPETAPERSTSNDPFSNWNNNVPFSDRTYDSGEEAVRSEIPDNAVEFKVLELKVSSKGMKAVITVRPPIGINKKLTPVAAAISFPDEALNCRVTSFGNETRTTWISPVIELPRPFAFVDTQLVQAGIAFSTASTFAAAAFGGGGGVMSALQSKRFLSNVRVFTCTEDYELVSDPFDYYDNPMQFMVNFIGGSYTLGALVSNFLLMLFVHLFVAILFFIRKNIHRQDRTEAKIWAGYPDIIFSIGSMVVHGSTLAMTKAFATGGVVLPARITSSSGGHIAAAVILFPLTIYGIFVIFRAVMPPSLFRLRAKAFPTYLILERQKWKREQRKKKKKELKELKKKEKERQAKIARGEDPDAIPGTAGGLTAGLLDKNNKKKKAEGRILGQNDGIDIDDENDVLAELSDFDDDADSEVKRRKRKQKAQRQKELEKRKNAAATAAGSKNGAVVASKKEGGSDSGSSSDDDDDEETGCCASVKSLLYPWISRGVRWRDVLKGSRYVERYAAAFEDCSTSAFLAVFGELLLTFLMAILEGIPAKTGDPACSYLAMMKMLIAGISFIGGIMRPYCVRLLNWYGIIINLLGVTSLMLQVVEKYQGGSDTAIELADLAVFIIFWLSLIPVIWMFFSYFFEPSMRMRRIKRMIRTGCAKPPERDDDEDRYGDDGMPLPLADQIIPLKSQKKQEMMASKIKQQHQNQLLLQQKMAKMLNSIKNGTFGQMNNNNGRNRGGNYFDDDPSHEMNEDDVELLGLAGQDEEELSRRNAAALMQISAEERDRIRRSSVYKDLFGKVTSTGIIDEVIADKKKKKKMMNNEEEKEGEEFKHHSSRDNKKKSSSSSRSKSRDRDDRHHHHHDRDHRHHSSSSPSSRSRHHRETRNEKFEDYYYDYSPDERDAYYDDDDDDISPYYYYSDERGGGAASKKNHQQRQQQQQKSPPKRRGGRQQFHRAEVEDQGHHNNNIDLQFV